MEAIADTITRILLAEPRVAIGLVTLIPLVALRLGA